MNRHHHFSYITELKVNLGLRNIQLQKFYIVRPGTNLMNTDCPGPWFSLEGTKAIPIVKILILRLCVILQLQQYDVISTIAEIDLYRQIVDMAGRESTAWLITCCLLNIKLGRN